MNAQHGRIVVVGVTDEKISNPLMCGDLGENGMQVILTQLARSTTGRRERRQRRVRATELVPHRRDGIVKRRSDVSSAVTAVRAGAGHEVQGLALSGMIGG